MLCWMNGEYLEHDALRISPFDHGFLYGLGFFETFRTYEGRPLFFKQHLARLERALQAFRIVMPYTIEELEQVVMKLNEENGGGDGYFRLNVSAGEHEIGLAPTQYEKPNVIMFRKELPSTSPTISKSAAILNTPRNTPETGEERFKSHHYGNNVFARFELPSLAQQEGIFLTADGFVAEGITSNVFWVKDDVLYTPNLETGILAGITRGNVIKLAESLRYTVKEGLFLPEDLLSADECFVTTAIQHIVPIHSVDGTNYQGAEGAVVQALQVAYEQMIDGLLKGES